MAKDDKYPLAELVKVKKKRLEQAEDELKKRKEELIREEEKLKEAEERRDKAKLEFDDKLQELRDEMDEEGDAYKIEAKRKHLESVVEPKFKQEQERCLNQEKEVRKATQAVEDARVEMLRRFKEVEKLSMHKEEWKKEMRKEQARLDELETDEIGTATHILRKMDEKKRK